MISKEILAYPEMGVCASCSEYCRVRDYFCPSENQLICFACWNASQVGCMINSKEWEENIPFVFYCEYGITQDKYNIN